MFGCLWPGLWEFAQYSVDGNALLNDPVLKNIPSLFSFDISQINK
jgi:hypothetical protein